MVDNTRTRDGFPDAQTRADCYRRFHVGTEERPSAAVVRAAETVTGISALDLPPLYEAVDTDALDRLGAQDPTVTTRFTYVGLDVVVEGDEVYVLADDEPA